MEPFFQEAPLCFSIMRKSTCFDFRIVFYIQKIEKANAKTYGHFWKKGSFGRRSVQLKSRRLGLREVLSMFFLNFFHSRLSNPSLAKRLLRAQALPAKNAPSGMFRSKTYGHFWQKGSFGCRSIQLKSRWLGLRQLCERELADLRTGCQFSLRQTGESLFGIL